MVKKQEKKTKKVLTEFIEANALPAGVTIFDLIAGRTYEELEQQGYLKSNVCQVTGQKLKPILVSFESTNVRSAIRSHAFPVRLDKQRGTKASCWTGVYKCSTERIKARLPVTLSSAGVDKIKVDLAENIAKVYPPSKVVAEKLGKLSAELATVMQQQIDKASNWNISGLGQIDILVSANDFKISAEMTDKWLAATTRSVRRKMLNAASRKVMKLLSVSQEDSVKLQKVYAIANRIVACNKLARPSCMPPFKSSEKLSDSTVKAAVDSGVVYRMHLDFDRLLSEFKGVR